MDDTTAGPTGSAVPGGLWVNGDWHTLESFDPNVSLLQFLRDALALKGTKEGCASGDCGACTLILANADGSDAYTVNGCITPLGAALGHQVVSVEGIGTPKDPHPVQAAMVAKHGSQCGFCTPGFVVSMVGAQLKASSAATLAQRKRSDHVTSISGNLCRCTGYRPILDAAHAADQAVATDAQERGQGDAPVAFPVIAGAAVSVDPVDGYVRPRTLIDLEAQLNDSLTLIAGTTDAWLDVTQQYIDQPGYLDISEVVELKQIDVHEDQLRIGAGVRHAQLLAFFADGPFAAPGIVQMLHRFGSPQIRARGTLGGNLASGSPIADWSPVLLALDAQVVIGNAAGQERVLPLDEFFLDYRRTALAANEYLRGVLISTREQFTDLCVYKLSKREEDDISSVLGAFALKLDDAQQVVSARIAYGGVAATARRFVDVEQLLIGQVLDDDLADRAVAALLTALQPISDVRASADYRRKAGANLLRRAFAAHRGDTETLADWLRT